MLKLKKKKEQTDFEKLKNILDYFDKKNKTYKLYLNECGNYEIRIGTITPKERQQNKEEEQQQ